MASHRIRRLTWKGAGLPRAGRWTACRRASRWFAAAVWIGLAAPASSRGQMPAVRVVVQEAKLIDARETISLVGTVHPRRNSRIASEVAGLIREFPIREGDRVGAGDVLCRLNDENLRHQRDEASAKLAALQSRLDELLAGTRKEDLAVLRAELEEADAALERWKFEIERVERLHTSRDSNEKEYHDTRAAHTMAERRKMAAQAAYDKGVAGPRRETIAEAEHSVAAQRAVLARLESDLRKTELRAPFGGFVTQRFAEAGEWLDEGGAVVELAELDAVLVRTDAPESTFPYVAVGDKVRVHCDALRRVFEGRVKHIVPQADLRARTVPIDIEIENPDHALAGGMFTRVTLPSGEIRSTVAVPKDAVFERDGVMRVALVGAAPGPATAALLPVTLGVDVGDWVTVVSGNVPPGSKIITRGNERIMPFPTPIEIVDEFGRPAATPDAPSPSNSPSTPKGGE